MDSRNAGYGFSEARKRETAESRELSRGFLEDRANRESQIPFASTAFRKSTLRYVEKQSSFGNGDSKVRHIRWPRCMTLSQHAGRRLLLKQAGLLISYMQQASI